MTERNRTAVHVDDVVGEPEFFRRRHTNGSECLVDLDEREFSDFHLRAVERCSNRATRLVQQRRRVRPGDHPVRHEFAEGSHAALLCRALAHHHDRRTAVADLARVAGGHRAVLVERRSQRTERLHGGGCTHSFVVFHHERVALALRHRDGHDFVGETTGSNRRRSPSVTLHRHTILFVARDVTGRVALGAKPHEAGVERAPQSVFDDRVGEFGVAVAESAARTAREIRRVGHRLHAGGDHDVGLAARNHLVGEIDGVETRETHLVHVHARHVHRDASFHRGLARWHLALAGHQHLSDDHMLHFVGSHTGALQRFGDSEATEVGCGEVAQRPAHFADRRARPRDDVRTWHVAPLLRARVPLALLSCTCRLDPP